MPDKLYQRIYLSPHLDDAVLSCGGRIYQERQAGLPVLVVTLMAGDPPPEAAETPFASALHASWGLDTHSNPVAVRRAEDEEALSVLGAHSVHWGWPDCIYRRHPTTKEFLYHSEAHLFGPVQLIERGLIVNIARRLAALPLAPGGRVYTPMTVGGHVDHRLVRQATEAWRVPEGELVYYEDYPYVERPEALAAILENGSVWRDEIVPLSEAATAAKIAAVACYRSQISTFFANTDEMAQRLRAYAASASGGAGRAERYWYRARA
jgi:LmbE family N-acetylglucosaminyl deacetylase